MNLPCYFRYIRTGLDQKMNLKQGWAFGPPGPARCFSSPIGMMKLSPIPARSGFGLRKSSPSPIRAELVQPEPGPIGIGLSRSSPNFLNFSCKY